MTRKLIVHETGPDGDCSYELIIGQEIAVDEAEELIVRTGGTTVYAMHRYEAGKKIEHFVSKAMYDQFKAAVAPIDAQRRTIDEIRADIDQRARPPAGEPKPWWAFWR